ncbi:hypothetical protein O6H91_23G010700 [Diphasiastrum complanatum]|uniref:Uncharacterized protein n=1 Tax=Diphasiastrum complanatum TaxID=34168 RepID=A0ACC2A9S7_DIPCM|nr:hypothetical protein O6H91_23G010700 [Diphasiastrum complanatum]
MFFRCLAAVTGLACMLGVARMLRDLWWQPWQICKRLQAQGVKGPPFIPILGNQPEVARLLAHATSRQMERSSHGIVPYILPDYTTWSKLYGDTFLYTFGSEVRLTIADPALIKEILSNYKDFPKVSPDVLVRDLFGDGGLALAEGEKWAQKRRILNPGFQVEKLKAMVEAMSELTTRMLSDWERRIVEAKSPKAMKTVEIDVLKEYQNLTADVIAHTAFGTSYEAGKMVFKLQRRQQAMVAEAYKSICLPGLSYLPTPTNLNRWKIRKVIEDNLRQIVEKRLQQNETQHNDLLGIMISAYKTELLANHKDNRMSIQDIVDECKTFFFAGHETTASLLTWTTMLLALHSDWQERARAEVMGVCGRSHPSSDMLSQLKLVGMVLNEALRLYPATSMLTRFTDRDMKLGKLMIPKGTVLFLHMLVMMHNKQLWGEDADNFSPERFSKGIAQSAKHPWAFIPFSIGPRNCIGQVFALMEAKVVLCKLLQKFSFQLSPAYVHAPGQLIVIQPKQGMQILLEPIE